MDSEWLDTTLGSVVELKRGYDLPKQKREPGKIPVISSSGESDAHSQAKVRGPGVVTGRYGTIGQVFYSEQDFWPLNTTLYVCDFKGNNEKFIYYFLKTIDYLQYSDKAAVPGVNRNHLHLASVRVPESIEEQKAIAHILGTLDDKIELNRQMNATLEAMAQALFKSWFVDFDPVIDNALAAGNSIPEPLQPHAQTRAAQGDRRKPLPAAIQQQFPSRFVFNDDLGWVPEGWEVAELQKFGDIVCGKTPSKNNPEYFGGDIPFIKIPDMHTEMFVVRPTEFLSKSGADSQPKKSIPRGSVCVSCIATVGKVVIATRESHTNQQINSIVPRKKWMTPYLYFYMLKLNRLFHDLASGGSTTLNMNTGTFSKVTILSPAERLLEEFYQRTEGFTARIESNLIEVQTLSNLRDTLLPKLLSGQLRIPAAEKLIESVQ